jgi:hypothetical protein
MPFTRTSALIGENCVVTIAFGGFQDGTPSAFTPDTYTCIARSVRFSTTVNTTDVSALCDSQTKAQVTKASGTLEIELLVDSVVGPLFYAKDGYYVQVVVTPGTLAARTFIGIVTSTGLSIANEEAVTESATITLGANGVTTAWA